MTKIEGTKDTPEIVIDEANSEVKITGPSYPENAFSIYTVVLDWITESEKDDLKQIKFEFYYSYINSSSKKVVYEILLQLESMGKAGTEISIVWYYDKYDEDMFELGQEFDELVKVPFQLVGKN